MSKGFNYSLETACVKKTSDLNKVVLNSPCGLKPIVPIICNMVLDDTPVNRWVSGLQNTMLPQSCELITEKRFFFSEDSSSNGVI
ncbi:hypothetical protein F2P79_007510 [Pimephales promelas]|nr:hypothetical protein F2P79_007510 [Pimephales promelas]